MCGIAGYMVTEPKRVRARSLQNIARGMLLGIQNRGREATGLAYVSVEDKHVYIAKAPVDAEKFLAIPGHTLTNTKINHMPRMMLLHTRAATQGLPDNNQNNHPLYSKQSSLCLVHNGWISNDDMLKGEFKLKQDAEVDSEVYLRLIEKFYMEKPGDGVEVAIQAATKHVYGSLACGMIQGGRDGLMWLWKDTGQLAIAKLDWGWCFASTKAALLDALLRGLTGMDGSINTFVEPSQGELLSLHVSGKVTKNQVETADWSILPDILGSRVSRTWENGKLKSVRRSRGSYAHMWGGEYGEGWHHGNSYGGMQTGGGSYQCNLPAVVRKGSHTTHYGSQSGTNYQSYGEVPLPQSERSVWFQQWKRSAGSGCYCQEDYQCYPCRGQNAYCAHKLPEAEKA